MSYNSSRGGAKPQMLPGGSCLTVTNLGEPKRGLYEISSTEKSLARLVELPHWLADYGSKNRGALTYLDFIASRAFAGANRNLFGASQGHVFLDPPPDLFDAPAVGIDDQIVKRNFWPKLELVFFFVYEPDYRLAEKWKISGEQFRLKSKPVETGNNFEPQHMISLKELRRC